MTTVNSKLENLNLANQKMAIQLIEAIAQAQANTEREKSKKEEKEVKNEN